MLFVFWDHAAAVSVIDVRANEITERATHNDIRRKVIAVSYTHLTLPTILRV